MIWKYKHGNVLIIDLDRGSESEAKYIEEEYQIPEHFSKKITIKDFLPTIDSKDGFIFLSLSIPHMKRDVGLNFISGDNILVISHNSQIDSVLKYYKNLEIDLSLDKLSGENLSSDTIMIRLIKEIFTEKLNSLNKLKFIIENNLDKRNECLDITHFLNKSETNISLNQEIIKSLEILVGSKDLEGINDALKNIEEEIKIYKRINRKFMLDTNNDSTLKNKRLIYFIPILLVLIIMLIYLIWQ